jgi:ent-kaurene oxidase
MGAEALKKWPSFLRPFVAKYIPEVKRCDESKRIMQRLIRPIIAERIEMEKRGEPSKNDMVSWMIKNSLPEYKFDVNYQAHAQLSVSLAAIHTTTMQSSHTWFDLAAHPEYVDDLRKEWNEVLATEPTGVISKSSMPKLKKLDSFLKESQRMNPLGPTTFSRRVNSDIVLPNGEKLPKGSYLAVATHSISFDPALWQDPEKFNGFRYEKLRQEPGSENKHQFVTTGLDSMHFGHGKHACPGRFFAANVSFP